MADGALDVGDRSAGAAHDVVVVVRDPGLVTGGRTGGLDAAYQSGVGEGAQDVVYRLVGDSGLVRPYQRDHRVCVDVRMVAQRCEHRQPGPGHAQRGRPQLRLEVGRHPINIAH